MDNLENISISASTMFEFDNQFYIPLYLTLVMLGIFSFFGVVGNALVLYVYLKKHDNLTSTFFIIVLAAIDIVTCLLIIPWTIYMEYVDFNIDSDFVCKIYQFFLSSNIPFSVFIMVAIAVDRYFCICHPFLQAITMLRAQIISAVMGIYATALGSLVACMFGVYHIYPVDPPKPENKYNQTVIYEENYTETQYDDVNQTVYYNHSLLHGPYCTKSNAIFSDSFIGNYRLFHVAQYLTSLVCIMILYALIYHMVHSRRSRRLRQSTSLSLPLVPRNTTCVTQDTEVTVHNGDHRSPQIQAKKNHNDKGKKDSIVSKSSNSTSRKGSSSSSNHEKNNSEDVTNDNSKQKIPLSTENCLKVETTNTNETKTCLIQNKPDHNDTPKRNENRRNSRKERIRAANIKTAIMLSVVTVVFVLTYAPAFLMLCFPKIGVLLEHKRIFFHYMYFANNVANPIIYSFMNQNFRTDLKQIFRGNSRH